MDKFSWALIALIFILFVFVILPAQFGTAADTVGWGYYIGFSLLLTFCMIAVSCLPIVIICLFINRIPDIDYAVWFATAATAFTAIKYFI